jgi:hypothetical protein|tara:strand:+ start:626 stop:1537 length:912 start_codon:yes stop_codon:yes gene_type:complete
VLEEPTSPAVRDQPRGRLLFGAVLGSFAVIAALVASAAAGAGGPGPTIDQSRQLSAERDGTHAGGIDLDSHGATFSFEVCIDGVPHRWEGDDPFGWKLDDRGKFEGSPPLEPDPDEKCEMADLRKERGEGQGLFDFVPDFEAFESCLAEEGADPDSPHDRNRTSVIVVGPDGRTVVQFSDDVGSVTVTGTDEGVEVTIDGGAAVVDVEAREQSREKAYTACESLLPEPPQGKFGFRGPFEGGEHGLFDGFFAEFIEEFEMEFEFHELDPGENRRERRSGDLRELFSGVADDGGRCEGADTQSA